MLGLIAVLTLVAVAAVPSPAPAAGVCGYVDFRPTRAPRYVEGVAYERIRATVHYQDGHTESADFPYPWVYPDGQRTDPWSDANLRRSDFAVTMQLPPPGFDRSTLPPLIAFVIAHTDALGYTSLRECPKSPAPPTLWDVPMRAAADADPGARLGVIPFLRRSAAPNRHVVTDACVTFTNRADRALLHVRFLIRSLTGAGVQLRSDALEIDGPFESGAGSWIMLGADAVNYPYCVTVVDAVAVPPEAKRVAEVRVSVAEVEFDDGTSWHAPVAPLPNTRLR